MKIESPVLRRLGPIPFWRGSVKCLDELQRIYTRAEDLAAKSAPRMRAPICDRIPLTAKRCAKS